MLNFDSSIPGEKRRSILFLVRTLDIGGAEKQMISLVERLKKEDDECHVFSLEAGGVLEERMRELDIPLYSGGLKRGDLRRVPWKVFLVQIQLIRVVNRLGLSVVHSFLPLVTFMGALAARMNRVPLVITSRRALGTHQERYFLLKPLDQIAIRLSDYVTVNSRAVWDDTAKRDRTDPNKLVLIYNGVDARQFESSSEVRDKLRNHMGLRDFDKVVVVVANLIPYKGHLDFLKAAREVKDTIPESVFWLIGEDRGIQKTLESEAQNLRIRESVLFMGRRSDIPSLLAASDLFVLPSHEEGFSNVILEAMAAGLPVVATKVGGNSEAVVDGMTGWLVPPQNPKVMAEKIVDLLKDPHKARSWGEKGKERVKRFFTVEQMVEKHLALYAGAPVGRGQRE
jgi:glycosyltransferase involved in cell wall biosynthesis